MSTRPVGAVGSVGGVGRAGSVGSADAAPAWEADCDAVVVGSGVAGLTAALDLAAAGRRVLVMAKGEPDDATTSWAQGGIAVVRAEHDPGDDVDAHVRDTLAAGAGLSDPVAVGTILAAGPAAFDRLRRRGARFDAGAHGLLRTVEGGHSARRVVHAGGDATGAEIERALLAAPGLPQVLSDHLALDVALDEDCHAAGLSVLDAVGRLGLIRAGVVVLATGGSGHLYASTTNPAVATGDGLAIGLRAGARVADLEFVQFHPTVLWTGPGARGHRPLVTEAVRGEGAVLIDAAGARIMPGVHPLADLAPRDVVSLAITRRLRSAPAGVTDHVFLDATALPAGRFRQRFPTVAAACRAAGIDPETEPIPVAPAAHYQCGGIVTDLDGRTAVPGLYAAGEVARTGLHGANRLASNSLLEGLVMGERVAVAAGRRLAALGLRSAGSRLTRPVRVPHPAVLPASIREPQQALLSAVAGIGRDASSLAAACRTVAGFAAPAVAPEPLGRASLEAANLRIAAAVVLATAAQRTESRGCHVRTDHVDTDPGWRRNLVTELCDGELRTVSVDLFADRAADARRSDLAGAAR